jgi:hypothetical protein
MSTIIYHNHHIIPKHAGGTDHPDNIARLTTEEHAEAHRLLYEKYDRWQDKKAYEGLAGFKDKEQIIKEILSRNGKSNIGRKTTPEQRKKMSEVFKGKKKPPRTEEHRQKLREARVGLTPAKGMIHTPEWKEAHSKRMSGKGNSRYGVSVSEETKKKISEALIKRNKTKR